MDFLLKSFFFTRVLNSHLIDNDMDQENMDCGSITLDNLISLEQVEMATFTVDQGVYVQEAIDSGWDYSYFDDVSTLKSSTVGMYHDGSVFVTHISTHHISSILKG